jgi:hypothetical protein
MECSTFVRALGIASLCVSGALACGSSSSSGGGEGSGTGAVTGSFAGQSFAPVDATAVLTKASGMAMASIYVSNVGSICGVLLQRSNPRSLASLQLSIQGPGTEIATGTYTINGNGAMTLVASAAYLAQDAQCNQTVAEISINGTITVTASNATSISGSFDALFQPQLAGGNLGPQMDHVTGTFSAPVCNASQGSAGTLAACGS